MENQISPTRLAEIRKSISQMTDEELYAEIGSSRNNRHQPTKPKKAKSSTKTKGKSKGKDKLDSQIGNLTPEQAAALLKQLQG